MKRLAPVLALACGWALPTAALAEPLPVPSVDFSLKARVQQGAVMDMAHSGSRVRVHISGGKMPSAVLGIIDMQRGKMLMMLPDIPKTAVEAELPPAYRTALPRGEGTPAGQDRVAGNDCTVWKIEKSQDIDTPAFACITPDGIPLRTEVENKGKRHLVYEATALTRGPQNPSLFALPPGTKVMKVPASASGLMQGLGKFLNN